MNFLVPTKDLLIIEHPNTIERLDQIDNSDTQTTKWR